MFVGNFVSERGKWEKRFAAGGLSDNKYKWTKLVHLIGPAGHKVFYSLYDTGDNYESAITNLDICFMTNKN